MAQSTPNQKEAPISSVVKSLSIYPNPLVGAGNLSFELSIPGHVRVSVYDVLGRRVQTLREGVARAGKHTIPLSLDIPGGTYFVRVEHDGTSHTISFVNTP